MLHFVHQTLHQGELYPLKKSTLYTRKNNCFYLIILKDVDLDFLSICNWDLFQQGMQNVILWANSPFHKTVSIYQDLIEIWWFWTLQMLMLWTTSCLQLYNVMYSAMPLLMPVAPSAVPQCFSLVQWPISSHLKYLTPHYSFPSITRWLLGILSF